MDVEAGRPIRKFSVVIPARNAAHLIGDQLSALAAQTYSGPWEVIVADNGSTDRTATSVLEMADRLPDLRVVDASKRSGASHARNIGALEADGDYLLFVDADDQVRRTWLEEMACVAPQADAVGGDILSYFVRKDGTRVVEVATMDGLPTVFEFWPFAPAGNFGIRKDVFGEIGGFNEDYRVCEDVEISWRIHTSGHSLRFVPGAVLECRERSGWWTLARQSYAYARRIPTPLPRLPPPRYDAILGTRNPQVLLAAVRRRRAAAVAHRDRSARMGARDRLAGRLPRRQPEVPGPLPLTTTSYVVAEHRTRCAGSTT